MQHAITSTYISLTTRAKLVSAMTLLAAVGLAVVPEADAGWRRP